MSRTLSLTMRRAMGIILILLVIPVGIMAQDAGDSDQAYKFSKEELTQMLAPIALYPDALTAQVLMASTYPLEVVEADRWRDQNPQLTGNELDTALQDKPWDPSVKALTAFPTVLGNMDKNLALWMRSSDSPRLGQAARVQPVSAGKDPGADCAVSQATRRARGSRQ